MHFFELQKFGEIELLNACSVRIHFLPLSLFFFPLFYTFYSFGGGKLGDGTRGEICLFQVGEKNPPFCRERNICSDRQMMKEGKGGGQCQKVCVEKISSKRLTPFSRPIRCDAKKMLSPPFFRGKNDRVLLWRCFQEGKALVRVLLLFLLHGSFFISILSITISQGWPK